MNAQVQIEPLRLKLREPFVTGTRTYHARQIVRLRLEDRGLSVLGEAAPLPGFSRESAEEVERCLRENLGDIESFCRIETDISQLLDLIGRHFVQPAARFAVETLALKRRAHLENCTVSGLFGDARRDVIEVNATIPNLPAHAAKLRAEALCERGYRVFKVKLGPDLERNVQLLGAVREVLPEGCELRGDANGCWDLRAAGTQLDALAPFALAYIEQPLPAGNEAQLAALRGAPVPIALDESLCDDAALLRALDRELCDVFILKPTVLGGFARTREIAQRILACGKRFVITSALAGAIERRACFDLACTLPGDPFPACGLNTAGFILEDPERDGLCISRGHMMSEELRRDERAAI